MHFICWNATIFGKTWCFFHVYKSCGIATFYRITEVFVRRNLQRSLVQPPTCPRTVTSTRSGQLWLGPAKPWNPWKWWSCTFLETCPRGLPSPGEEVFPHVQPQPSRWWFGAIAPHCITCHFRDEFGPVHPLHPFLCYGWDLLSACLPIARPNKPSSLPSPRGLGALIPDPWGSLSGAASGSLCRSGTGGHV